MKELVFPCFIGADFIKAHGVEINLKAEKMYFSFKREETYPIKMYKGNTATLNTFMIEGGKTDGTDRVDVFTPEVSPSTSQIEERIASLLKKYPTVARTDGKIESTSLTRHIIEYDGPPIACKPYKKSPAM